VYNNSLNCFPIFLILAIGTGEIKEFIAYEPLYSYEFLYCFTLLAILGFCLYYTTNLCTIKNSPFSIALTHNIKDVFSTTASVFIFNDLNVNTMIVIGIMLSFIGSFMYSMTKIQEISKKS